MSKTSLMYPVRGGVGPRGNNSPKYIVVRAAIFIFFENLTQIATQCVIIKDMMLHILVQVACTAAAYFPYTTDCMTLTSSYASKAECAKYRDQVNNRIGPSKFFGEDSVAVGDDVNVGDATCLILSSKTIPAGAERFKNRDGFVVTPEVEGPRVPMFTSPTQVADAPMKEPI